MLGVVLWSDSSENNAVIWCEDHGDLAYFDGTHLFEHSDPKQGYHPDWKSHIFNYGRHEVKSFLISSAIYWLDQFHVDGLRVDAVASMLYLDYSRKAGEWEPNRYGGRENLEAIEFLRELNTMTHGLHPGTLTIAEGGLWGSLTGVSVGVVAVFVIFGALLNAGEAGQGFMNVASAAAGRLTGGAAKVSVLSSAVHTSEPI